MTWTKLDDGFPDHEKIIGLSDGAFRLHVEGLCYANRLETDGRIPKGAAFVVARKKHLRELLGVVWEEAGTHYTVHDFLDYNPSRSELDGRRQARAMAGAKGAASRWHGHSHHNGNAPDPSRPDPRPDPDPSPPLPPADAGGAERAARAKNGSRRKRDVAALEAMPKDYEGSIERMRQRVGRRA